MDTNNTSLNPVLRGSNILQNIVYSFNGSVSDVMIGGKFVLKDQKFTTLDKDQIFEKARELCSSFI